ncbi:MAG: hypothetical protein LBU67_04645 [Oscillospiraceae bacterium]|jgi:hypothetical protein|nr:hypothetical protein [Oscillospiraceae bacterium]
MNLLTRIGIVCIAIALVVGRFADVPFLAGVFMGSGLCLLAAGLLPQKEKDALKNWKRAMKRN